jgi:putative endonuclease
MGPLNKCGDDKIWRGCHAVCMGHRLRYEQKVYAVYMLASKPYGTLYIGVTGDLPTRITQHREHQFEGFTKKYNVTRLVWFENFDLIHLAIQREKTMKKWPRDWKINLIERENLRWDDLYPVIL